MSEFAPTALLEAPKPPEHTEAHLENVTEFPTSDDSDRYDADFAYDAAVIEDMQRSNINEARAQVEQALAQKSPLVEKYQIKLANAEVSLAVNAKETEKFYNRYHKPAPKSEAKPQEALRLAA